MTITINLPEPERVWVAWRTHANEDGWYSSFNVNIVHGDLIQIADDRAKRWLFLDATEAHDLALALLAAAAATEEENQ